MAKPGFFNTNENTSFPFLVGTVGIETPDSGLPTMLELPDNFIVDCGFILGPESGFIEGQHTVYLYQISRVDSTTILFEFRTNAPDVSGSSLIFQRSSSDSDYTTEFLESDIPSYYTTSASLSESLANPGIVSCGEPFWSGYLVTGSTASLFDRIAVGETITRTEGTEAIVEPGLIQNLNGNQLVSLNLANSDRTRAVSASGCPDYVWPHLTGITYTKAACLQGDIRLIPGYNTSITQSFTDNALIFSPIQRAGLGEPCGEIALFPGEKPPVGASNNLLGGDYYCNEVFRTVNGLQGPNLYIYAGSGISIIGDANTNSLQISVNLSDLSLCTFSTSSVSAYVI